jgi:hypothetical protein
MMAGLGKRCVCICMGAADCDLYGGASQRDTVAHGELLNNLAGPYPRVAYFRGLSRAQPPPTMTHP